MPFDVYSLRDLVRDGSSLRTQCEIDGKWVPARPTRYPSFWNDLKLAWMVFRGKADVFQWPEQESGGG